MPRQFEHRYGERTDRIPDSELTPERPARERAIVAANLARSHAILQSALAMACPHCDAHPGTYCFGTRSRARGLCLARYKAGCGKSLADPPLRPGELHPLAKAVRNVQLHERQAARLAYSTSTGGRR
jgi:hypothetical protein